MSSRDPPDPDDHFQYYKDELRMAGKSEGTIQRNESAFQHFRRYLDETDQRPGELTDRNCKQFIQALKNTDDLSEKTAKSYCKLISRFYDFYSIRGTFETNPMDLALDSTNFDIDSTNKRRDLTVAEMAQFLKNIAHPFVYTILFVFLKTGIRSGELCNLDARDLHIDHPKIREVYPSHRPELRGHPDSIYVPPRAEMKEGAVANGEERECSNKRKRGTIIPVDRELKRVLIYWLALRQPSSSDACPVFTATSGGKGRVPGNRHTPGTINYYVTKYTEKQGWWEENASLETNVTPHYCRHFFTTHMRDRTNNDEALIKYIRGDTSEDVIDDYTHGWQGIREAYLDNIYSLF